MGSIRTYNQCRHRWHNVIKHRGTNHEDINSRLSTGIDDSFHGVHDYGQPQDPNDLHVNNNDNQDWNSHHQQINLHQMMEQQQHQQGEEDSQLYQTLQKYGV